MRNSGPVVASLNTKCDVCQAPLFPFVCVLKKIRCFVQTGGRQPGAVQAEGEATGEAGEVHGVPPLHGEGARGWGGVP